MSVEGFESKHDQDRQMLLFLIEHDMVKGKFKLLYRLFRREVKELSLMGASKVISANLGVEVGIQTMRTLRNKCQEFERGQGRTVEKTTSATDEGDFKIEIDRNDREYRSIIKEMEEFKPMDVFSGSQSNSQSPIKWVGKVNS